MLQEELNLIIAKHAKWLRNEEGGKRANLYGADLDGANLRGANLYGADLGGANLYGANLRGANLYGANLRGANLRDVNLYGVNLRDANLRDAHLRGANLYGANLGGANLTNVQHDYTTIGIALACPAEGSFIAWKRCGAAIVKLRIPANAKRSSATTAKCRASHAEVLKILCNESDVAYGRGPVQYKVGKTVVADSWDEDRWNECSNGIHFFMNREHAETWER